MINLAVVDRNGYLDNKKATVADTITPKTSYISCMSSTQNRSKGLRYTYILFTHICREQHTQLLQENWFKDYQLETFGAFGRFHYLFVVNCK